MKLKILALLTFLLALSPSFAANPRPLWTCTVYSNPWTGSDGRPVSAWDSTMKFRSYISNSFGETAVEFTVSDGSCTIYWIKPNGRVKNAFFYMKGRHVPIALTSTGLYLHDVANQRIVKYGNDGMFDYALPGNVAGDPAVVDAKSGVLTTDIPSGESVNIHNLAFYKY